MCSLAFRYVNKKNENRKNDVKLKWKRNMFHSWKDYLQRKKKKMYFITDSMLINAEFSFNFEFKFDSGTNMLKIKWAPIDLQPRQSLKYDKATKCEACCHHNNICVCNSVQKCHLPLRIKLCRLWSWLFALQIGHAGTRPITSSQFAFNSLLVTFWVKSGDFVEI